MAKSDLLKEAIIKALESIIGGGNVKEGMGNEVGDKISKYIDVEIQSDGDEFPRIDKESISSYLKSIVDPKQISSVDKFINDEKGFDEVAPYFFIDSPEDEDFKKIPNREIERWAKQELSHYIFGDWKNKSLYINEETLTEANVPSNIRDFAKRKGVSSLVNKVAGWAEKVGARIAGGTAVGMNYATLVLDLDYKQQGEIRINTDNETIKLYDEPVDNFNAFQRVYVDYKDLDENVAPNHNGKSSPYGSGYEKLEEKIAKALDKIKEGGPGLWANIHAQRKRGEKPSPKGSKDYKAAVAAGKRINKEK